MSTTLARFTNGTHSPNCTGCPACCVEAADLLGATQRFHAANARRHGGAFRTAQTPADGVIRARLLAALGAVDALGWRTHLVALAAEAAGVTVTDAEWKTLEAAALPPDGWDRAARLAALAGHDDLGAWARRGGAR